MLRLVNMFTIDTEEYYLRYYKVNDAKTFKNLVVSFYALWNHKIQEFTRNIFSKVSSKFLAYIKQYLGHTGTLTNVQNNCIKLSRFGVDITKLFIHWKITRNISCREKFFNQKILFQVFRTNFKCFFHYLCRFISG